MAQVTLNDGRVVHYNEYGTGAPMLLITGWGGAQTTWGPVVERLAPNYRVITFDNRDAGLNSEESAAYSIGDMAADAAGLLDALGIDRAHVLGHSMGGFIALQMALERPALIDTLLLVGTSAASGNAYNRPIPPVEAADWIADPGERMRARSPLTHAQGFFDERAALLDEVAASAVGNRMTRDGYNRQGAAINDTHDVRDRLGEITARTAVFHGDSDPMIPASSAQRLGQGIPNAQVFIYPGVGHHPFREAEEQFFADLAGFLHQ